MSIPSTISNVIIEGNTVEAGGAFSYKYALFNSTDARIFNNYFSGIESDSGSSIMLWCANCTTNIQGNTFVRGSNLLNTYIVSSGSNDQIITNNIFDSSTSDGSNTILASNLTANSLYDRNKNQIGYSIVPLGAEKTAIYQFGSSPNNFALFNFSDFPPNTFVENAEVTSGFGNLARDVYVIKIYNNESSPTQQYFSLGIDISKSVPYGAKIIDAKVSIYSPTPANSLDTGGTNNFFLTLSQGRPSTTAIDIKTYNSALVTSWMNNFSASVQYVVTGGNVADISTNYQVLEIATTNFTGNTINSSGTTVPVTSTDISSNYVVKSDCNITANINFAYKAVAGSSLFPLIVISPIIITYTW